jgi:hypothetical protein
MTHKFSCEGFESVYRSEASLTDRAVRFFAHEAAEKVYGKEGAVLDVRYLDTLPNCDSKWQALIGHMKKKDTRHYIFLTIHDESNELGYRICYFLKRALQLTAFLFVTGVIYGSILNLMFYGAHAHHFYSRGFLITPEGYFVIILLFAGCVGYVVSQLIDDIIQL